MFDNYFTLFGLPQQFNQNLEVIQSRYYQLQQAMHPDQFVSNSTAEQALSQTYSAKISEAYHVLKDPYSRAKHLLKCLNKPWIEEIATNANLPVALLNEQMMLREEFEDLQLQYEAVQPNSGLALSAFKSKIALRLTTLLQQLKLIDDPLASDLDIQYLLLQIPFYMRLKSSISQVESRYP